MFADRDEIVPVQFSGRESFLLDFLPSGLPVEHVQLSLTISSSVDEQSFRINAAVAKVGHWSRFVSLSCLEPGEELIKLGQSLVIQVVDEKGRCLALRLCALVLQSNSEFLIQGQ